MGESRGVFATRSPHRPNPVGLSLFKIEKVEAPSIFVSGVDVVSGTPIIDIKPYLPHIEAIPDALGGWPSQKMAQLIEVEFLPEVLTEVEFWEMKKPEWKLKNLIIDTLKLDPRPVVYRGFEDQKNSPYRSRHAVRIIQFDIHFEFISKDHIRVLSILPL